MARYAQMAHSLGMRVRQLRMERQAQGLPWSQAWLATASGCSRQTVVFIERGTYVTAQGRRKAYIPGDLILAGIADALGVSVAELAEP